MNTRKNRFPAVPAVTAAVVFALAGVAGWANAQGTPARNEPGKQQSDETRRKEKQWNENHRGDQAAALNLDLRSAGWLTDRDVYNQAGEDVGDVDDLVIDRGSGRIDYAVIKTEGILGLGGRTVALPYDSLFRWDAANERFIINAMADQLKAYPDFSAENWGGMLESAQKQRDESVSLRDRLLSDYGDPVDPYRDTFNANERATIEGEVTKVDRVNTAGGEFVVVTVKQDDNSTKRVSLGPSWYITGWSNVPFRGDHVRLDVYPQHREPGDAVAARTLRLNDKEIELRGEKGEPAWFNKTLGADAKSYAMPYWRSLLASSLDGMKVQCRNADCGTIDDIIIDRRSGQIALVSIDPDENFLGIADTKRLVPWTIAYVAVDGTLRIDATKEMVLASPVTPSDLSSLNAGSTFAMAFKAFEVPVPEFKQHEPASRDGFWPKDDAAANAGWRSDGAILAAVRDGSPQHLRGEITEVRQIDFDGVTAPATAIVVEGDSDKTVLLGPASYMKDQSSPCYRKGSKVTIDAVPVSINGRQYLVARRISTGNDEVRILDASNRPLWEIP